jgi:mannose-6-phosphate isomerase-like protein (cupin superfamily)
MSDDKPIWFENKPMGQRVHMITLPGQTGGEHFVAEYIDEPHMGKYGVPAHRHPTWTETFKVISGRAQCLIGEETHEIEAGDSIVMPPDVPHIHPWSISDEPLHVQQTAVANPPDVAGLTANLQAAVTIFGLARDGKVNKVGTPRFLQLAVLINAVKPATYPAGMSKFVLKWVLPVVATLGRLLGKKVVYPKYGYVAADRVELPD